MKLFAPIIACALLVTANAQKQDLTPAAGYPKFNAIGGYLPSTQVCILTVVSSWMLRCVGGLTTTSNNVLLTSSRNISYHALILLIRTSCPSSDPPPLHHHSTHGLDGRWWNT